MRGGAALFVLIAAATLTTTFTATTTVPTSNVGKNVEAREISELTPTGCSSLALTSLLTGSGTFGNTNSHVLILGSAGADTITDSGQDNCIVGGAGKDKVTGTSSDICITGPTTGATYKVCKTSA